jgi:two-component system NarL family response regulator
MRKKIRILIVDDHFIVRIGLLTTIGMIPEFTVVGEASTGSQAIQLYRQHLPDVVLMDVRLPDFSGIEATAALREEFPEARIIMISTFDSDEDVYRAFQAGARGYLLKNVLGEELARAIQRVHAGQQHIPPEIGRRLSEHEPGSDLTPRETEVLRFLVKGLSNKEIGDLLGFTENTAKFHVKSILGKLQASDRTEAATAAIQRGILHLD